MEKTIVDYAFNSISLSNPDGTLATTAINCTVTTGPGATVLGAYPNALDLGASGRVQVSLPADSINFKKFCVRIAFKTDVAVTGRQNLAESDHLPFAFFLDKTNGTNEFKAVVSVCPAAHGWAGTTTEFFTTLSIGNWYVADLVYDIDTVAVFINGTILSVHAFPSGTIQKFGGSSLFIGTWVDGARNHFNGQIAALKLYDDIPIELEAPLDERRSSAEWFISYKHEAIKNTINLGVPTGKYYYSGYAQAYVQDYPFGLIMYNEGIGAAFEMHGLIFQHYKNSSQKHELGYLVSDEGNTTKPGGKKSVFRKGGIYWSPATGAVPVTGQIFLDYEMLGESAFMGFPVAAAANLTGGKEQVFQAARMYYKNGASAAHEVHGAILNKFLSTGGVGTWGYPVSNEMDVKRNNQVIGKSSDFEACTIYWSSSTGAFEVHGDIRLKYKELNGPLSDLGFPTSDEANIPGASGPARYNTFQNGSILWFGNWSSINVCYPFRIFLGRINSKESEGAFMGQNDLYLRAIMEDNGHEIFRKRFPNSGDFGGQNIVDINQQLAITIVPNHPNRILKFTVDVWESDSGAPFGGGDDHLGVYNKILNMANAWGMRENNGVFNSGSFSDINSITWSVQPQVNINNLSEVQKWWGVQNKGTATLSYQQYASAFRDVDSDTEWWDVTDWLEKAFYELVVKGVAGGGNCFGMSLEAIYSWKHRSLLSLPLNRFTDWNTVVNEFNIKHQYQVGASAIWWFVGQFLSGNTHDPVDVFNASRNEFFRGCNPVACIAQNYDFSGAPHCVLPFEWNSSVKPWQIRLYDPNFPNQTRTLFVDPDKNEFSYDGGSNKYKGGEWSGGRFHYMPYSILSERPRTPIWDAIVLLLLGTVVILGEDTQTTSLTDENGNDLDIFGQDAINRLQSGKSVDNKFFSVKGFDAKGTKKAARKKGDPVTGVGSRVGTRITAGSGVRDRVRDIDVAGRFRLLKPKGVVPGELYMRKEKETAFVRVRPELFDISTAGNVAVNELVKDNRFATALRQFTADTQLFSQIKDRDIRSLANDKNLLVRVGPELSEALKAAAAAALPIGKNYIHKVAGIRNGLLRYAVKSKLNEFVIDSTIKNAEANTVGVKDLGTHASVVTFNSTQNKTVSLQIRNKLGVGNDILNIFIDKIPAAVGKEIQLNIKPGLSGLDIISTAEKVNATISVEGNIGGKILKSKYGVDIEGGLRIRPSTILTDSELRVGTIETLFGQVQNTRIIKSL